MTTNTEFVLIPQGTRPIFPRLKLVAENLVKDILQEPGKYHTWFWIPNYKGIRIRNNTSYRAYNVCVAVASAYKDPMNCEVGDLLYSEQNDTDKLIVCTMESGHIKFLKFCRHPMQIGVTIHPNFWVRVQ
jgi:hypothetical protein